MTRIRVPGAACVIPETLGGLPVTELADKVFAGSEAEEVYLPKSLKRIGRYLFYGCEKLHALHVYGETTEIGGGIFTGCKNMRELFVHVDSDGKSALRDFVTELSERILVHVFISEPDGGEREAARLVFPLYYDEAVENTPARLIGFAIHGSGQKYRYCLEGKSIRFEKYDKVFKFEKIEESVLMAAEVAICRLQYPMGLWEEARIQYEGFLRENLFEVILGNMDKAETVKWLLREFAEDANTGAAGRQVFPAENTGFDTAAPALSPADFEQLISEAAARHLPELSGVFMDLNRRLFGAKKKKSFDL